MANWDNFFLAIAGAAGALIGLIFVGISISLAKIILIKTLPGRAFISLVLLLTILISSLLFLVPQQSEIILGIEILTIGIIVYIMALKIDLEVFRETENKFRKHYIIIALLNQLSTIPYLICGIMIISFGRDGIYWIVPAIVFSFIKAVLDAWVFLVEINR